MVSGGQLGPLWRTVFYIIAIYDPGLREGGFKAFPLPMHSFQLVTC